MGIAALTLGIVALFIWILLSYSLLARNATLIPFTLKIEASVKR